MTRSAFGRDDLLRDLRGLGVRPGSAVFVHASMRALGPVIGGPRVVIEALQAAVGPSGLLAMPGFSGDAKWPESIPAEDLDPTQRARIKAAVPGFDPARSATYGMGALAEAFRTFPGTRRSPHPSVSVCLNGAGADGLAQDHALEWACGPDSPLGRLAQRPDAHVLLIGVGWNRCTALHTAETLAETRRTKIRHVKSGPGDAAWHDSLEVADDLGRLFPDVGAAFEETGAVTLGHLGDAKCRLCALPDLMAFATPWIDAANRASGDRH